ncbi:programmed cell death protein 2 [Sparassis latifolia]
MSAKTEEYWSDSDEEAGSDVETAVQLGIPDGLVASSADLLDVNVSRIGGHPTFLTSPEPPFASALCKNCSKPMELLVEVWCPLEGSPNDRVLYIWGCASGACQRKEGSVRAWRGLRHNQKYADKLSKKLAKQRLKEEEAQIAEEAARQKTLKANPFSLKTVGSSNPFALGAQVFGNAPLEPIKSDDHQVLDSERQDDDENGPQSNEDDDDDELVERLAAATLSNSEWASAPAYAPLYLSTVSEYLPPAPKSKLSSGANIDEDDEERRKKDTGWALEGYENSMEVDHAFERFTKRISYEGEQCLRYELGGTPLPFSSDEVFNSLFPAPSSPYISVTNREFAVVPALKRTYNPSALPHCPHCKSKRVFECQLMPNLISVLKRGNDAESGKKQTDEERRQEVLRELKGGHRVGMEWGTCMVFSCENDCSIEQKGCWREEVVLVQWDE